MAGRSTIRRTRYGLSSLVLALAVGASCVIAGVLGSRYHWRWDVTATRQHTLSPRTLAVLRASDEPRTIVVSADMRRLEPQAAAAMADLLAEFERQAPSLDVAWIDTGSPSGRTEFADLIESLAAADAEGLSAQRAALTRALEGARELSTGMGAVSDRMKALSAAYGAETSQAQDLERQAGVVRTLPARLEPAIEALRAAAEHEIGGASLPAVDVASDKARPAIAEVARAMQAIHAFADQLAAESRGASQAIGAAADALAREAQAQMELGARLADSLDRLRPSDPLIVARTLQAGDAVLITGPSGTLAIDFPSLFPRAQVAGDAPAERLFAGEQLIATALAALDQVNAPILVIVHAEERNLVDARGGPTTIARSVFGRAFERMRLTRIEPVEWRLASPSTRPDLRAGDPERARPVVWWFLAPPSAAPVETQGPAGLAARNERLTRMAEALRSLLAEGESVLISLDPSDLPAVGEADPFAEAIAAFGITADTGRPLLRRESSPAGQVTFSYLVARAAGTEHPIAEALAGLAVAMPWTCPLTLAPEPPSGVRAWPLLEATADRSTWGESSWLLLRDLEARGRVSPLAPPALTDPPRPDAGRDSVDLPATGAWTLAAAAERREPGAESPQRVIVIASPAWIHTLYAGAAELVGGRRALRFPGNAELFESSVQWLAGRDELIGAGPQSRDVPRIQPIDPRGLTIIRWTLIVAPGALTLLLGLLVRLWRA